MRLPPDTLIGRYRITAPLGSGGMGEVYRGHDPRLGRDVAIKVLHRNLIDDPQAKARFEREARLVAALSHPNVLAIHDVGTHEGTSYLVTELLEGESLRHRLNGTRMPWTKAAEIGAAIAAGAAAAHARGLVHRDLKPENIFLTSDERVKILDFGLAAFAAQVLETGAGDTALTQAGAILGTVGYMAPEQVRGEPAQTQSDLFAIGCILYEMTTGNRAFSGDTAVQTLTAILEKDPEPASRKGDVPPAFDRLIASCLEKNPAVRQQSARDLSAALLGLSKEPGAALSPSPAAAGTGGVPESPQDAHELYLRARYLQRTATTDADSQATIDLLQQAIRLDPGFAPAHAALGRAYIDRRTRVEPGEARLLEQKAFAAVEKALSLDPGIAEAYVARGDLLWTPSYRFAHVRAVQEYRRALEKRPDLDSAHEGLARVFSHVGLFEAAIDHAHRALESNPGNGLALHGLSECHLWRGNYDAALEVMMGIPQDVFTDLVETHVIWALARLGRDEEASSRLRSAGSRVGIDRSEVLAGIESLMLAHTRPQEAEQRITRARVQGFIIDHHATYFHGCTWAQLGNAGKAVAALRETAENGFPCYPLMAGDPHLDPIRQDAGFVAFLEDLEKQHTALRAAMFPGED